MAFRLSELAEIVGGRVEGDPDRLVESVRTLQTAGPEDLSFVTNPRYRRQAAESRAGALLSASALAGVEKDFLLADEPYYALAQLLATLYPRVKVAPGIHPTAVVESGAEIDSEASIGPYAVVETEAKIGAGCRAAFSYRRRSRLFDRQRFDPVPACGALFRMCLGRTMHPACWGGRGQ